MTGLRQGELIALRWKDFDWRASLIRVRRNYTRGRFGTSKTKRSSRAVPMPERVAAVLKERINRSEYTGADDLVFCHPETGGPFDASKMSPATTKRPKSMPTTRLCLAELCQDLASISLTFPLLSTGKKADASANVRDLFGIWRM